jgi:hypothetical protein
VESLSKPLPVIVSVREAAPAGTAVGEMDFTCGVADGCVGESEPLVEEFPQRPKNAAAQSNARIARKRR